MKPGEAMRADDFKPCAICGKGVAHVGVPLFYRVTVEQLGIDATAVRQTDAMERFFGGHPGGGKSNQQALRVARAFQDPEISVPIGEPVTALLCMNCGIEPHPIAMLMEKS